MTAIEKEILQVFRELNPEQKKEVFDYIAEIKKRREQKQNEFVR